MTQRIRGDESLRGQVLGYTEWRNLDIAMLNVEGNLVRSCEFHEFLSPHEVVAFFIERPPLLGIGTMETLALSAGRQGWRAADFWIDEAPFHPKPPHDEFPFFWGPFQTHGGKSLAAIALLSALRRRWPGLPATETAPGECYMHLVRSSVWPALAERRAVLCRWLNVVLPEDLAEHQWEAAMSAYAMWMGLRGKWPIDLHRLTRPGLTGSEWTIEDGASTELTYRDPTLSYENLIFPAGPVSFFWPPDERAEQASHPG